MPDFQNFNAPIPVVIKNSDGTVLSDKVDVAISTANKLTVIREIADVQCGKIHIFTENEHAAFAMS